MTSRAASPDPSQRPYAFPFFLPYIVPVLTVLTHYSPNPYHSLFPPIFVWLLIPILDVIIPLSPTSSPSTLNAQALTPCLRRRLESCLSFRLVIYLWPPTQFSLLLWAIHRITSTYVSPLRIITLLSSLKLVAAEGINCAHELLHRRSRIERFLGDLLLYSVCYGHFSVEHAKGHHVHVATPNDPATLRYGESFYSFLPRTIVGGLRSAWAIEVKRLHLKPHAHVLSPVHNRVVRAFVIQTFLAVLLTRFFGVVALAVFFIQAGSAVVLLEQTNAIEHYGLVRKNREDGTYEPVGARHSWDAPHAISSYLMFKLELHAHHHLRTFDCLLFLYAPFYILPSRN